MADLEEQMAAAKLDLKKVISLNLHMYTISQKRSAGENVIRIYSVQISI